MNLGITSSSAAPPAARRATTPGWRDPRLWAGLVIVAASVFVGALVVGSSDDTVPVWATSDPLGSGHVLSADDLSVRRVRFADTDSASLYFRADHRLPADLRLRHDVAAGELLSRTAVAPSTDRDLRQVPVSVARDQVPRSVGVGDAVDVYLRPGSHASCQSLPGAGSASGICDGRPVLSGVTVLEAPVADEAFGSEGGRMLVLGMSGTEAQRFFALLASADDVAVTVVGRG